ncbi:2-phosphosulfolactate phosphatase [Candidatus Dependentiae bacterium]
MFFDQTEYNIRCEWGQQGVQRLAPISDVVIIVDVISFSTAVDIATARGAYLFPYDKEEGVDEFGKRVGAVIAGPRSRGFKLATFGSIEADRLVLPSPNGATLSCLAGEAIVLAGCLRNARAVAHAAMKLGNTIAVIPAGERWPDTNIRFATEDFVGAGAILAHLEGDFSPEAQSAVAVYNNVKDNVYEYIKRCSSGKKLTELADDVYCAC